MARTLPPTTSTDATEHTRVGDQHLRPAACRAEQFAYPRNYICQKQGETGETGNKWGFKVEHSWELPPRQTRPEWSDLEGQMIFLWLVVNNARLTSVGCGWGRWFGMWLVRRVSRGQGAGDGSINFWSCSMRTKTITTRGPMRA